MNKMKYAVLLAAFGNFAALTAEEPKDNTPEEVVVVDETPAETAEKTAE